MDTATSQLVDIVTALRDASIEVPAIGLSLPILELLHAILINYTYRSALKSSHADIGWGQGLLATIVMSSGGGSTAALLLGNPLGILKSNRFWGVYGATYWLMFSNPYFYQFLEYLFAIPFMEQLFTAADGVLRTAAVVNGGILGVARNSELGEDKWAAKIICGALAGCGGGLWVDAFRLTSPQWSFSTPRLLRTASVDMKASFITAAFYTAATTPALCEWLDVPMMKPEEAQAWGAVVLSSGLIYRTYVTRWQQKTIEKLTIEEEKKEQ
ncbi:hypothetical protein BJV82DRAFT_602145 [Fennellomyces sp. T-0311]|nr:hypothetical protein BJV82DRAFT_602145 [Fennellomyces sp. T-0311]